MKASSPFKSSTINAVPESVPVPVLPHFMLSGLTTVLGYKCGRQPHVRLRRLERKSREAAEDFIIQVRRANNARSLLLLHAPSLCDLHDEEDHEGHDDEGYQCNQEVSWSEYLSRVCRTKWVSVCV